MLNQPDQARSGFFYDAVFCFYMKKNSDKMVQVEFGNHLKMKILEILVSVILILGILYVIQQGINI